MQQFLFILHPPRAGSTLLQVMLSSHPEIAICPEVLMIGNLIKRFGDLEASLEGEALAPLKEIVSSDRKLLAWKVDSAPYIQQVQALQSAAPKRVIEDLFRFYRDAISPGAQVVGIKRGNLVRQAATLYRTWNRAKFIFVHRDGRACAASMVKHGFFGDYRQAALRWQKRMREAERFRTQAPEALLFVRYEEFVQEPEQVSRQICQFIGVEFRDEMLRHDRNNQDLRLISKGTEGYHQHTGEPVTDQYVHRWREELTSQDLALIEGLIGETLLQYDYPLMTDRRRTLKQVIRRFLPKR